MESQKKSVILAIEDALDQQLLIRTALEPEYEVLTATTATTGFEHLHSQPIALVLIDVVLPDSDGYAICQKIRSHPQWQSLPILFVSSKESVPDKLTAFRHGANDYIVKPFNLPELKARVDANIGRPHQDVSQTGTMKAGPIEIDLDAKRVFLGFDGQEKTKVHLTKTEFALLSFFMSKPDRVFSRGQLLQSIWGSNLTVTERTVDTHISKLRNKIKPFGHFIEPVHGMGYRFNLASTPATHESDAAKAAS